jgi:hypothetical protein
MLDPDDPTVQIAVFGEQVRQFLQGDIGDYLLKRADKRREEAIHDFGKVNADDPSAVRQIQVRVLVADSIKQWLADAIIAGMEARKYVESEQ